MYCRKIKDKFGKITREKYEPRLKRDKQSLSLGQYDTFAEAKTVHEIATFFYDHNQFGRLDFEDGRYSSVELGPNEDSSRYFDISPLTENKEGKEKSKLVSRKAKEVYKQFKKEQAEYWQDRQQHWIASILMRGIQNEVPRRDDVVRHLNGHLEARPLDLMDTQLQQPSHNDQVSNSTVGTIMLDNCGVTSNTVSHLNGHFGTTNSASHATGTFEPTSFNATNSCLPRLDRHGMLESSMEVVLTLPGGDSQTADLPESHIFSYEAEAGPSTASGPFLNSTSASGFNFDIGNQVEAFCFQVVNTSQKEKQLVQQQLVNTLQQDKQELKQEKQELKRKISELEAQLSDKQTQLSDLQREFREHILSCSGEKRPSKKR